MRNAMTLFGIWIGIILAAYALVYMGDKGPTPAQLALIERMAERTYADADGRFQFEMPLGWRVSEVEDGVYLAGPVNEIEAWIVAFGGPAEEAVQYACYLASPCPGKSTSAIEVLDPPVGVRRKARTTFEARDEATEAYAVSLESGTGTLVLFVRCDTGACDRRAEELDRLESSLIALDLENLPLPLAVPTPVPAATEPVGIQTEPEVSVEAPTDTQDLPVSEPTQTESMTPEPVPTP